MDDFKALLKLILDEKSLNNIKSIIGQELNLVVKVKADTKSARKVKADTKSARSEATKLASELSRLTKANSMQAWIDNNSKAMKAYGAQINDIISKIRFNSKMTDKELDDLVAQFKEIQNQARITGNIGKSFGDKMKNAWEKFGQWGLASSIMMKAWHEFEKGIQFAKELDDALTDVAYTSNVSKAQLRDLGNSSVNMAKELKASATDVLEAVKIYSTAKASTDDILRKSKPAIMLSNVSGMSGAESSKIIQTALNQFELEDTEAGLMDIVDTLEYTSSRLNYDFTEGMKQITEGIEASGSVAKNAGLDFQEYAAMVGVAVEKTGQSGSTIGNAYKTIFSRITKASSIEGTLAEDISKAEGALRGIGVEVRDSAHDFRDMSDIMADIGKVWDTLDDDAKSHVGFEVAGTRQLNVLNSLFGAWDEYSEIVENSTQRIGMAYKNQDEYADSLGGHLEGLGSVGKSVWNNVLNSEALKVGIDLLTLLLSLVDKITSTLGSFGTVGLASVILLSKYGEDLKGVFVDAFTSIKQASEKVKTAYKSFLDCVKNGDGVVKSFKGTLGAATAAVNWWAIGIGAAIVVISLINKAIEDNKRRIREQKEEALKALEEQSEAANKSAEESYESAKKWGDLTEQMISGEIQAESLSDAFYKQADAMGVTRSEIQRLISDYGSLEGAMAGLAYETAQEATTAALEARKSAKNKLDSAIANEDNYVSGDLGTTESFQVKDTFRTILSGENDWNESYFEHGELTALSMLFRLQDSLIEKPYGLEDHYYDIQSTVPGFYYDDKTNTFGVNKDVSKEELRNGLNKIKDALDMMSVDGATSANSEIYNRLWNMYDTYDKILKEYWTIDYEKQERVVEEIIKEWVAEQYKKNGGVTKEAYDTYLKDVQDKDFLNTHKADIGTHGHSYAAKFLQDMFPQFSGATQSLFDEGDIEFLKELTDAVEPVKNAIKEFSDGSKVSIDTLQKLKAATMLSGEEWKKYQDTLLNSDKDSIKARHALEELLYIVLESKYGLNDLSSANAEYLSVILEEMGLSNSLEMSHHLIAKAQLKNEITANELTGVFESQVGALEGNAAACGLTAQAYVNLLLEEIAFGNNDLDTHAKIDKVKELASALYDAGKAYKYLDEIKNMPTYNDSGEDIITWAKSMGYTVEQKYDQNGNETDWQYVKDSDSSVILETIYDVAINAAFENWGVPAPVLGDTKDDTSSKKNEPGYKDSTKAIINRINLRADELKQQEEYFENALEIAKSEKDYEKQISLTNNLIGARKDRIDALNKANAELHNEAEYLRNTNDWNEDSWFDSQGNETEAYYELFNNSSKEQQDQIKDLFEKLSKYKKAYMENTEEILALNKDILRDEEDIVNLNSEVYEGKIRDIEHARDMALEQNPYLDTTSYYKQLQTEYHTQAEYLRSLDPEKYKEEIQKLQKAWWSAQESIVNWRWENSNRWISDRNTYNDWALFEDSEIDAWERVIKWLKEEYPNDLEKIKEAEQNLFEARKEEFDGATDFGNTYLESQKTLLQSYYDVTNSIAEAQHEINKELETSKTMYEYLDEDTRKLLFNQDDYNELSEELLDIQYKADKLQRQYERDLKKSTLETVESITSNYQMQYETLMKSYEIAKADLEIAKKKQKLNNVLNERNVRMFINGSWQWVSNTEDVANAKSELADAEYAKRVEEAGLTQQTSINNLTKQQDQLGVVIKQFENGVIDLDKAVDLAKEAIGDLPSTLSSMLNAAKSSKTSYSSTGSSSSSYSKVGNAVVGALNHSDVAAIESQMAANSAAWHTADSEGKKQLHEANTFLGGLLNKKYDSSSGTWSYASGTNYTAGGLTLMGEDGFEAYIGSNGRLIPISQPTIGNIPSGGVVFNADQMKNLRTLWDMSNLNFKGSSPTTNAQPQQTSQTYDNRIIINGMTVDSGSADGQALISALRRYVGNH